MGETNRSASDLALLFLSPAGRDARAGRQWGQTDNYQTRPTEWWSDGV